MEANFLWEYFSLKVEFLTNVRIIHFGNKFNLVSVLNHKKGLEC